ncbi:ankyrin repeat-containing protein BDA1, partial [Eurytemora carolleeae]|uniref:ankyrin repeat-containing protein BDA1 n=1 Tax=Eurytemora carolleeae TaxID=1294199 RepID=UPI000C75E780
MSGELMMERRSVGPAAGQLGSSRLSGSLSRAGTAALTSSLAEPPSPSKPGSMEDAIRMWLKIGNVERLQGAVLDGYGWFLRDQTSRISKVNKFLRKVPDFQEKIDLIHDLTIRGELGRLKVMLDRKIWITARDHFGHSPMHKAVMANQEAILRFLIQEFPESISFKDNEGRTPLHYASALKGTTQGVNKLFDFLVEAGADENVVDIQGKPPLYYKDNP